MRRLVRHGRPSPGPKQPSSSTTPRLRAAKARRLGVPGGLWLATRLCLSAAALGLAGLVVGRGTLASFNATTTNPGNTFSTASVLMSNAGTSPCTAVTSGNCGTVSLSSNTAMSPGSIATGTITITNSGSAPATMTLTASLDSAYTTSGFNAYLNLTIHDDSSGYCVYGTASPPTNGACDNLTGLTTQQANDAFPGSTAIGPLALPAMAGPNQPWLAPEAHVLTVTVEVIDSTVPSSATGSLDLSWSGVSLPGTAQ